MRITGTAALRSASKRNARRRVFGIEALQAREMMAADAVELVTCQVHEGGSLVSAMGAPLADDRFADRSDMGFTDPWPADESRTGRKRIFPIAEPDEFVIDAGETLRGNVLKNDFVIDDQGNDRNDALTIILDTPTEHGALRIDESGQVKYTPHPGFVGVDSFRYVATSEKVLSEVAVVTIEVREKIAPTTAPDGWVTDQGKSVKGNVLANDTPSMGADPGSVNLVARLVDKPESGNLEFDSSGDFQFTPDPEFLGIVQFTYVAVEGPSSSEPTLVTIDVQPQETKGGGFQKTPRPDAARKGPIEAPTRDVTNLRDRVETRRTEDLQDKFAIAVDHIMLELHRMH
ncbi:MAG: Ig-like domain-containing protein [Planctomycetota bacterium]